ncbi:hypothetical protein [Streptomyces canus]|uniref:hypothetical protein n=1 Tax=Streptomyces canus TaxID=58343 RepID=UPI002E3438D1|nr:hypothetical protein [Streptomyces canus]
MFCYGLPPAMAPGRMGAHGRGDRRDHIDQALVDELRVEAERPTPRPELPPLLA